MPNAGSPGHVRFRRIALLLPLGAFLTIAISWTAMWTPVRGLPERRVREGDGPIYEVWTSHGPFLDGKGYWRMQMSGLDVLIPPEDFDRTKVALTDLESSLRPNHMVDVDLCAIYISSGWPLRAMAGSAEDVSQSQKRRGTEEWRSRFAIQVAGPSKIVPKLLPLMPLWPGFVVNTLFYTGMVVLIGRGWGAARRSRLRRRGLCTGCGYPRTGLAPGAACPECGNAVARSGTMTA